jgi:hypothetical protein
MWYLRLTRSRMAPRYSDSFLQADVRVPPIDRLNEKAGRLTDVERLASVEDFVACLQHPPHPSGAGAGHPRDEDRSLARHVEPSIA